MDVLTDDHEREQVVRKWWHDNWLSLAVGIVIAVGGMVGYRYYQDYKLSNAEEYAYKLSSIQTKLVLQPTEGKEEAKAFIAEHKDIYGSLLSLDVAQLLCAEGKYEEALDSASFAAENGGKLVAPNAVLVKAHILTQDKKYDEAVKALNDLSQSAYAIEKNELLGDIYLQQGNKDAAHDAYAKALAECEAQKISINPILQMKADSLIKEGDTAAFERAQKLEEQIAASATSIKK
ncbi:MAG: tetratricopeptide repeat protein [Aeromonadales bacterium]|nr:tetratricopeptide repeat protein [Aeromonadales bacterium]